MEKDKNEEALEYVQKLFESEEGSRIAKKATEEYYLKLNDIMTKTAEEDIRESIESGEVQFSKGEDISKLAEEQTAKRMKKHGERFFKSEIENIMDAYNDGKYDKVEYIIRCEVLYAIQQSMKEFEIKG